MPWLWLPLCPKPFWRTDGPWSSLLGILRKSLLQPPKQHGSSSSRRSGQTSQTSVLIMDWLLSWDVVLQVFQVDRIPTTYHHWMLQKLSFLSLVTLVWGPLHGAETALLGERSTPAALSPGFPVLAPVYGMYGGLTLPFSLPIFLHASVYKFPDQLHFNWFFKTNTLPFSLHSQSGSWIKRTELPATLQPS